MAKAHHISPPHRDHTRRGLTSPLGGIHNPPQAPIQGAGQPLTPTPPLPQATDIPPELQQAMAAGKTKPIEGY